GKWRHLLSGPVFSPDGYLLAIGTADEQKGTAVRLIEWVTWAERRRFDCPTGCGALAFSPDGKTLASGHADTTILLWNVRADGGNKPVARLWADLGSDSATKAGRAVDELASRPEAALVLFAERLKPAQALRLDPAEVQKQIDRLDSETFAEREAASRQL